MPSTHGFLIRVKWSKTIQFRQRTVFIPLVRITGSPLCPVTAIAHAWSFCPFDLPTAAAFAWRSDDQPSQHIFTYHRFMCLLRTLLTSLGYNASAFGSHSFRRGGATLALQAGVPIGTIQMMGDWKSDAVLLYLTLPTQSRVAAQHHISQYLTHTHRPQFGFGHVFSRISFYLQLFCIFLIRHIRNQLYIYSNFSVEAIYAMYTYTISMFVIVYIPAIYFQTHVPRSFLT